MYYKITNQDCEIYKKLIELRFEEIKIEKENNDLVNEKIKLNWDAFLGNKGQQNWDRVTRYAGFRFTELNNVNLEIWKRHKDYPDYFVPNTRKKAGKEMQKFLNELKRGCVFTLFELLGFSCLGSFSFPYIDLKNDVLIVFLDNNHIPNDVNFIEITKTEFDSIRAS